MKARSFKCALGRGLICALLLFSLLRTGAEADAWQALQTRYAPEPSPARSPGETKPGPDPWALLRAIYLPFTEATERAALADRHSARQVSGCLNQALRPYEEIIHEAARRFHVPPEIIGAVIMAESGGNVKAQARTSTARGLMQTIAGTFQDARKALRARGMVIEDNPFDPRASIMAGTWYLDRMYAQAAIDREQNALNRQDIDSWQYPVEYYYAGPGNGRKKKNIVIVYAGGRRVVIDKPAYSGKVLRWARIMSKSG